MLRAMGVRELWRAANLTAEGRDREVHDKQQHDRFDSRMHGSFCVATLTVVNC